MAVSPAGGVVDAIADEVFYTLGAEGICRLAAVTAKLDPIAHDLHEVEIFMLFSIRCHKMAVARRKDVATMSTEEVHVVLALMVNCVALFDAAAASCTRAHQDDKAQNFRELSSHTTSIIAHLIAMVAVVGRQSGKKYGDAHMYGTMTAVLEEVVANAREATRLYESVDDRDSAEEMRALVAQTMPDLRKLHAIRWLKRGLWAAAAGLCTLLFWARDPSLQLSATACVIIVAAMLFIFPDIVALSL